MSLYFSYGRVGVRVGPDHPNQPDCRSQVKPTAAEAEHGDARRSPLSERLPR
jgi:hypothetical protein